MMVMMSIYHTRHTQIVHTDAPQASTDSETCIINYSNMPRASLLVQQPLNDSFWEEREEGPI